MNETEEDNKSEEAKVETPAEAQKSETPAEVQKPVSESAEPVAATPASVSAEPVAAEPVATESTVATDSGDESKDNESKAAEAPAEASEPVKEAPKKKKKAKAAKKDKPEETLNISEDKNWYVVQAFSGYEASVKRSLLERIERAGLGKDFGEILVPTEEVVEIRGGQKRKSERKFFPGYVLVQMDLNDETWHLVKDVPRVLGFIGGTADRPAPISDKEADAILQRVQDGVDKPRPKVLFDVGEVVLVTDGPFNDFNGVVEEVNFEKNKLLVAVQIFGRSTPVELEFSQVEKA